MAAIHVDTHKEGTVLVIRLPEDLTNYDEEPIFAAISSKEFRDIPSLVLDFGSVEKINGLGAGMLIKLCARSALKNRPVLAGNVSAELRAVLKVTEIDQAMIIYKTELEALAASGVSSVNKTVENGRGHSLLLNASSWAKPVPTLSLAVKIKGARNLNVAGRRAVGPVNGFGPLWQKIYRLSIDNSIITPEEAIAALKQNFPAFQPTSNRFSPSPAGITPGEIVLIDAMTPGGPVATGVLVLYADNKTFTFACPQGHPESGFVTFSAHKQSGGIVVQILGLARANDPLYESAFRVVGSQVQIRIWTHVLSSLAAHLGVPARISIDALCVDEKLRWSQAKNIWYNAQARTLLWEPVYLMKKLFGGGNKEANPA
jgi:anti-anti-sigma regulatory factor